MDNKIVEAARKCQSAEELIALAAGNGIELSDEKAQEYFKKLKAEPLEIAEDELDNVSGGGCSSHKQTCTYCGSENLRFEGNGPMCKNYFCQDCYRRFSVTSGPLII